LLMDRDEISNLYRGPSIDASYQVSVHLAVGFQRRRLKCEKLTDDRQRTSNDGKSSPCLWWAKKGPKFLNESVITLNKFMIISTLSIMRLCMGI
jgi:hypothetical protein